MKHAPIILCGDHVPAKASVATSTKPASSSALVSAESEPRYMALRHEPSTAEAKQLTAAVIAEAAVLSETRIKSTAKQRRAIGAILSELIRAADAGAGTYVYRPTIAASFTGEAVGRDPFGNAMERLTKLGLVQRKRGYLDLGTRKGDASRYYPLPPLIERARAADIGAGQWADHFSLAPDAKPPLVIARAHSKKKHGGYGAKERGRLVPVNDAHPAVENDKQRIAALNEFLSHQHITPNNVASGYTRIYNNADLEHFNYDQGGRLYDLAGEYQYKDEDERTAIRINGEAITEVDFAACHLTILGALMGSPVDHTIDPYEHETASREFVKAYATMALGNGSLPDKWLVAAKERYEKKKAKALIKGGIDPATRCLDLSILFKAKAAKKALVERHNFLARWDNAVFGWPQLQYEESCIMLDAMERLAFGEAVPSLCIHDALIVPASKVEAAKKAMSDCFKARLNVLPRITSK